MIGRSGELTELMAEATLVAASDSKVLITGESGVGKELLAAFIHQHSRRSQRPLVTINCAGVPESLLESELFGHLRGSFTDAYRDRRGLLEMADRGTVLLDEVGEMSLRMQALLLRFLESGEIQRIGSDRCEAAVDVRVIAATNRDLLEATRQKTFREDLYYRLNVVHLIVPPLRARREDIRPLFEHYLRVMSEQHRVAPCDLTADAWMCLELAPWPGNVRELRNTAERCALRFAGRTIDVADVRMQIGPRRSRECEPSPPPDFVETIALTYYERMTRDHESFWTAVYDPFMRRDLTRDVLRAIVRLGLAETRGNYRIVLTLFNLPPSDYKGFLSFLQKYECHLPFQAFRIATAAAGGGQRSSGSVDRDSSGARALV
ncbi:MAG TPA: sigma-54 dependent transcriptional regulator [Vicinamibacterales bacterium]|nr:sigma-54 dependent transcriptional regulator [Vicinamibacterales bacterium]